MMINALANVAEMPNTFRPFIFAPFAARNSCGFAMPTTFVIRQTIWANSALYWFC